MFSNNKPFLHPPVSRSVGLTIGGMLALYLNEVPAFRYYSHISLVDASPEIKRAFPGIPESSPSLLIWIDGFPLLGQLADCIKNPKNALLLEKLFSGVEAGEITEHEFNQTILAIMEVDYEAKRSNTPACP